ncbi:MAG: (2Fe-2S)-binding protein [Pyrinomonadaceae bacterium]|nr:(2Fe-2S)-binding protein [Pyrinomonadaceae bacterium]MCX7640011.1 (2Fe-2S)-binding protein [Pyrinomonadaceae bacterium]MDW8304183.1 2Fe-2S iron-sulfur cluster-binding protein [Acidobacteriota bacterium]
MSEEVEIKFEPDEISGLVAVGSYLIDAALRLGVNIASDCGRTGSCDSCRVFISKGQDLLSEPTSAEKQVLTIEKIQKGERLSCQTKLIAAGELVVVRPEKKMNGRAPQPNAFERFRKEFYDMPLEKKIASLLELEIITLGETLNFVLNSPFKVFDMLIGVMAELGLKIEKEEKNQKKPPEHRQ